MKRPAAERGRYLSGRATNTHPRPRAYPPNPRCTNYTTSDVRSIRWDAVMIEGRWPYKDMAK